MTNAGSDKPSLLFEEVPNVEATESAASNSVATGKLFSPAQHILLYSADEWEAFINEWVHYKKTQYYKVVRLSGPGDLGVDVAGFVDGHGFDGVWDNYQCKHYEKSLTPKDALLEIGKILWHSFQKHYAPPRAYYFVAPKECGMTLNKLLLNEVALKDKLEEKWGDWCADNITSKETIALKGNFLAYVQKFDFSIFESCSTLTILDEHRHTPYYVTRFGGGLPTRPTVATPPSDPETSESRYIGQLFEAYSDHKKEPVSDLLALRSWPYLEKHYHRQREYFYHAESLKGFARDTVPPGTFEDLQEEVYSGVADVEASSHPDAFDRVNSVTQAAAQLPLTANGLISVTKVQDKQGICHQLANEDRLKWVKE